MVDAVPFYSLRTFLLRRAHVLTFGRAHLARPMGMPACPCPPPSACTFLPARVWLRAPTSCTEGRATCTDATCCGACMCT